MFSPWTSHRLCCQTPDCFSSIVRVHCQPASYPTPLDFISSLSQRSVRTLIPAGRLPRVSSVSSFAYATREARYARAESALRLALSRCENEPSPLELQVRILEKGLQAWNAHVGRGYERVRKAEAALAAARRNEEKSFAHGSLSELQREKWMGIKERDEALTMVEKIKGLIKELNADIIEGSKTSPKPISEHSILQKSSSGAQEASSYDPTPKKATILFSGKFPMPYLENLPRSRRSVEPLRLPLQVTNSQGRQRSSTLLSEPASSITSHTSTTQPPTPHPATPTDEFGDAFIYIPLPLKSVTQRLAETEETRKLRHDPDHIKLPSYVGALLDEFGEDRIDDEDLQIIEVSRPSIQPSPTNSTSLLSPQQNHHLRSKRSKVGRPFSNLPRIPSVSRSPSQYSHSKENHDPSMRLHTPSINSATVSENVIHTSPKTTTWASSSSSQKHRIKSPGRVGNLMESVKRGVKKVSRRIWLN